MKPPSGVLWITEQVKTKLAAATWSIFLFFGGLIFILYFAHIRFMPELELGSSVALLAAAAITGAVYLLALSVALTVPSVIWSAVILNLRLFKPVFYKNNKLDKRRLSLWLVLPFFLELLAIVTSIFIVVVKNTYNRQPETMSFNLGEGETIVIVSTVLIVLLAWILMTVILFRSKRRVLERLRTRMGDHKSGKTRFYRAKLRILVRASAHSLLYWVIFTASCCCFILPMVLVGFVVEPNVLGDGDLMLVLGLLTFTAAINIFITIVPSWVDSFRWRVLISLSASLLLLLFFEATIRISSSVMSLYGLGNMANSFIVLKAEGCALLSQAGVNTCPKQDAMCILNNVHILSRVGATYYLRTTNAEGQAVNLTVPKDAVLSWGRRSVNELLGLATFRSSRNPIIYSVLIESLNICDAGKIVILKDQLLVPSEEVPGGVSTLKEVVDRYGYRYRRPYLSFSVSEQFELDDFLRDAPKLLLGSFQRSELPENLFGSEYKYPFISKDDFGDIPNDQVRWAQFREAHPNASLVSLSPIVEGKNSATFIYRMVNQKGEWKLFLALFHKADNVWTLLDKLEIASGTSVPVTLGGNRKRNRM